MSHFHSWDEVIEDREAGPTLPGGMTRKGVILGNLMLALHGAEAGLRAKPHTHPNDQIAIMVKGGC